MSKTPEHQGVHGERFMLDIHRAREVAALLLDAYQKDGVFGARVGEMPENTPPPGVDRGAEGHLALLTLTVALDYLRDHGQLWHAAMRSYADDRTSYLFHPHVVAETPHQQVVDDLQLHRLSLKPQKDARIWRQICVTLAQHFDGRVGKLIEAVEHDAVRLLDLVAGPAFGPGFPSLKGPKIRLLWAKILDDNAPGGLRHAHLVDVPVDIHTAQATLQTGCVVTEELSSITIGLRRAVQQVWREVYSCLGEGFHPLAVEEPLWVLSREGCRSTSHWPCERRSTCPVAVMCASDRVWLRSQKSRTTRDVPGMGSN